MAFCWSTVGRAKLLRRSTARSTDMHQSAFVHFGRPGGRPTAWVLLSVGSGRPSRSTYRELFSLIGNNGRFTSQPLSPTVENLTVSGRPSGLPTEGFPSDFFPMAIFYLVHFFLGLFPMTLLGFLLMFSSPINNGTVENHLISLNKFYQVLIKFLQVYNKI